MWSTDALNKHTRLHVFADPPQRMLNTRMAAKHFVDAYKEFDKQLFDPTSALRANAIEGETYQYEASTPSNKIPPSEQVNLFEERLPPPRSTGCPGNCLRVIVSEE